MGLYILYICLVVLAILYAVIMAIYRVGWRKTPLFQGGFTQKQCELISVLIPARNESEHITPCILSLLANDYPKENWEIIVINDHSDDDTADQVKRLATTSSIPITLLDVPDGAAGKKAAISLGVDVAKGSIIATTDADCTVPTTWISTMCSYFHHPEALLVTGPVVFADHASPNLLQRFQALDFLGLMGITAAGIRLGFQRMGNGANMAYRKTAFVQVGGYQDNLRIASGDDMFLIQKISKIHHHAVVFAKAKEAIVHTPATPDWHTFFQQRIRWGSKNAALPEWPVRMVLLIVFLFCWVLMTALVAAWFYPVLVMVTLCAFAVKAIADFVFLREMSRFFDRSELMRWFFPLFFLHILYINGIGLLSLFYKKYTWKARNSV